MRIGPIYVLPSMDFVFFFNSTQAATRQMDLMIDDMMLC
jgi:hypothetical protein